jgi:TRAP-type C4-dicarboxylate transport system substrate-binding protein
MNRAIVAAGLFLLAVQTIFAGQIPTLIMASSNAPEALISKMGERFTKRVNESGAVRINLIVGQSLGDMNHVMEQHMEGAVDIAYDRPMWFAPYVTDFNVESWGFIFRDREHMQKFYDSPIYAGLVEQALEKTGVRILGSSVDQPRVLISRFKVNSLADIQNMKMRVPKLETIIKLWTVLGTKPTQVAWSEAFLSLRTGAVDGLESDIPAIQVQKFHTAAKYITLTDHTLSGFFISVNEDRWQSLTSQRQDVLREAAADALTWASGESQRLVGGVIIALESEGAEVNAIDLTEFRQRASTAVPELEAEGLWRKGLWREIQDIK